MNLPIFLKEVDTLMSKLTYENLGGFVHEIARTLPEDRREYFLDTLKSFDQQKPSQKIARDDGYGELLTEIGIIKEKLGRINCGERCLDSAYHEEWDDWYNSDADEVLFSDPQGVLDDIDEAMDLVHRCLDLEAYEEGYALAEILSALEITADGDYNDYDGSPLYLYELDEHDLLSRDFKKLVRECLYLTYMAHPLPDRAEEVFYMMENFSCYKISLEDILQSGNRELPQFDEFLVLWIDCLGEQRSRRAEMLLHEAQAMVQDEDTQIENVRKNATLHPSLCQQLLEMKLESGENEKMLRVGMEALDKIPNTYVIRNEVALLTAEYACKLQKKEAAETCWLEAFRSKSTVTNYLRIRLRAEYWSKYESAVKTLYEQAYAESNKKTEYMDDYSYDEISQEENSISREEYCFLLFLEGQFDRVFQIGMKEKNSLGWSGTFMKQGLSLFLSLLYEGEDLRPGLQSMANRAASACGFQAKEYFKGTGVSDEAEDWEVFWQLFCLWKQKVQISDQQREKWLNKLETWISFRVEGIMNNNRRNYYGECASYIAALGEVQESMGDSGAKARIMENYKNQYFRRRAFHQELRNYGMLK